VTEPSKSRGTLLRLVLSPLILGAIVGVLWIHDRTGNPLSTDLLMAAFAGGAALEMARLLRAPNRPLHVPVAVLASALLGGIGLLAPEDAALRGSLRGLLVAGAFVLLLLLHLRDTREEAIGTIARTLLPILYIGLLTSFLRETAVGPDGARRMIWVVLVAKASDIGGWLVGKPFGRHKLIPTVSPGKSWEGLAGGLAGSVLVALLGPSVLGLPERGAGVAALAAFGLVVGGAAVLAGITQSGWKRRAGVKDSSPLIPEMGGLLDMLDSLLLAGPAAWAFEALAGGPAWPL
jgi:phosphatidate cytidylyltransferase